MNKKLLTIELNLKQQKEIDKFINKNYKDFAFMIITLESGGVIHIGEKIIRNEVLKIGFIATENKKEEDRLYKAFEKLKKIVQNDK